MYLEYAGCLHKSFPHSSDVEIKFDEKPVIICQANETEHS